MIIKYPSESNGFVFKQSQIILSSFLNATGNPLIKEHSNALESAEYLFNAPFALVSHNTLEDPVFNYGNRTALELFEFNWDEFISLLSRMSAEPMNQPERARLLAEVSLKGYIDDYQGLRISKTGKRFWINQAIIWNLYDSIGQYKGQAACFRNWRFI